MLNVKQMARCYFVRGDTRIVYTYVLRVIDLISTCAFSQNIYRFVCVLYIYIYRLSYILVKRFWWCSRGVGGILGGVIRCVEKLGDFLFVTSYHDVKTTFRSTRKLILCGVYLFYIELVYIIIIRQYHCYFNLKMYF